MLFSLQPTLNMQNARLDHASVSCPMQVQETSKQQADLLQTLHSSLRELHSKADDLTYAVSSIQSILAAQQQQQQLQVQQACAPALPPPNSAASPLAAGMPSALQRFGQRSPSASAEAPAAPQAGWTRAAADAETQPQHDEVLPQEQAAGWRSKHKAAIPARVPAVAVRQQPHVAASKGARRPAAAVAVALALASKAAAPGPRHSSGHAQADKPASAEGAWLHAAAAPLAREPLQQRITRAQAAGRPAGNVADRSRAAGAKGGAAGGPAAFMTTFDQMRKQSAEQATPVEHPRKPSVGAAAAATLKRQTAAAAAAVAAAAPKAQPANSQQTSAAPGAACGNLDGWLTPARKRKRAAGDTPARSFGLGAQVCGLP